MRILSLETSSPSFSLAVSEEARILREQTIKSPKVLSSSIIAAIRGILKKSRIGLQELDGFAVGLGPGSFTSLRVGLATVKGLAFVTPKPVVGISSLDVLAMNVPKDFRGQICTLGDAKRNLVYAGLYQRHNGELKRASDYLLVGIEELLAKIDRETFFVGDGVGLFKEKIVRFFHRNPGAVHFAGPKDWYPRARNLALLAYPKFLKGAFDPADRLSPIYLYPEHCQVQK